MNTTRFAIVVGTFFVLFTGALLVCMKLFGSITLAVAPALIAGVAFAYSAYLGTDPESGRKGRGPVRSTAPPRA